MALTLVPRGVRALAEQLNAYYRVLRGADPDSIDLRLNGGGHLNVHHSGTNAVVFSVTDAGIAGSINGGNIQGGTISGGASGQIAADTIESFNIKNDTIMDADVNTNAAINGGKIGLGTISGGPTGQIAADTIRDVNVSTAAGIQVAKLAHVGATNVLKSNGTANVGGQVVNADVSGAAGIVYSKLNLAASIINTDVSSSAAIGLSKLATVSPNQIVKDVGSGVVGGGLLVDANVAAAGTANIAVNKLNHVGAGNVLRSNGSQNVAGPIVTGDMVVNTINGDRIADSTIPGGKILGGAPPAAGAGAADAWKVYATAAAGTTVSLQQVAMEMLAANVATRVWSAVPTSSSPAYASTALTIISEMTVNITTAGGPLLILYFGTHYGSVVGTVHAIQPVIDNSIVLPIGAEWQVQGVNTHYPMVVAATYTPGAVGGHIVDIRQSISNSPSQGGVVAYSLWRSLTVIEFRR